MGFRIGDLLGASLPLNGTELVELEQGGNSRKVSVADMLPGFEVEKKTADDFGAVGDGVTDDTAALLAARDALGLVELTSGKTYAFSSQIAATGHGQGFFCKGKATLKMLTGDGQFDRSSYAGSAFASNACGVYSLNFKDYKLQGVIITMEPTALVRTIKAGAVRGGRGHDVFVEVYGFQECQGGIFAIDSLDDSKIIVNPHDCGTSNDTLPSMQVTGLSIDDGRLSSVATTRTLAVCFGKNILLSGAALAKYGQQTDALNAAGIGDNHGLECYVKFDGVGELFDCFGSYVKANVQGTNCWAYGVKLIHGAQHCIVDAIIDRTAGAAVVVGGSNSASQDTAYNIIRCTASNVGILGGTLQKVGVHFDGSSATYKPRDNQVTITLENTASMTRIGHIEAGSNNHIFHSVDGGSSVLGVRVTSSGSGNAAHNLNEDSSGYLPNRFYGGGFTNISNTTPLAIAPNVLHAIPYKVNGFWQPNAVGLYVQSAGSGLARIGIYKWENGKPGGLVMDCGTVSVGSIGNAEVSIVAGAGIGLPDGQYALAFVTNVACSVYASSAASLTGLNLLGVSSPGNNDNQMTAAFTYGALPSTFPTPSFAVGPIPNLWMRKV